MKNKLNNLISQTEFVKSWAAKKALKTKRTETGIDVVGESLDTLDEKKKILKKAADPDTKVDTSKEPKPSGGKSPEVKEP